MTRNQSFAISIMHALSPKMNASVEYDALGDSLEFNYRKIEGNIDECFEEVTKTITIYHNYGVQSEYDELNAKYKVVSEENSDLQIKVFKRDLQIFKLQAEIVNLEDQIPK